MASRSQRMRKFRSKSQQFLLCATSCTFRIKKVTLQFFGQKFISLTFRQKLHFSTLRALFATSLTFREGLIFSNFRPTLAKSFLFDFSGTSQKVCLCAKTCSFQLFGHFHKKGIFRNKFYSSQKIELFDFSANFTSLLFDFSGTSQKVCLCTQNCSFQLFGHFHKNCIFRFSCNFRNKPYFLQQISVRLFGQFSQQVFTFRKNCTFQLFGKFSKS